VRRYEPVTYIVEVPKLVISPCRYCRAPIMRALEDRGNPMMVEEHPAGPYVVGGVGALELPLLRIVSAGNEVLRRGVVVIRKLAKGEVRYQSHFATCERRAQWGSRIVTDPLHAEALGRPM
jgi:hypothetical protein